MALLIVNEDHFNKVKAKAEEMGLMPDLQEKLDYLASYADHGDYGKVRCKLGWDFAPLSFAFVMERQENGTDTWKYWFNGGLIFHPGRLGPDESLSVELCQSNKPHWSVHT